MKLLKNSLLISLFLLVSAFAATGIFAAKTTNSTYAASAETYSYEKYIKISSQNSLTNHNIQKLSDESYSIISNHTISISPNLFEYRFNFEEDFLANASNDFIFTYSAPITLEDNEGEFDIIFNNETKHYYYSISENGKLTTYTSSLRLDSSKKISNISNDFAYGISFNSDRELVYIECISYLFQDDEKTLEFQLYDNYIKNFEFNLVKPIANFTNQLDPIVLFDCVGHDAGTSEDGYHPTWLPSERIYNSVTIKFFRNYTKNNPLFFNINLNGFTYYYKLFTTNDGLLMQYFDTDTTEKLFDIYNKELSLENTFNIEFNEIGRYEIEFYDSTFNTNLSQEENIANNANYYKTSFYIYDDTKTYENVYLVSESFENGQPLNYIISNNNSQTASTLNTDIRVTFKNLYFLSRKDFEKIRITVTKTLLTGSVYSHITEYNYATSTEMNQAYENNEDFYLDFSEDARYAINVYYGTSSVAFISSSYEVVKLPKTHYQVGEEGDPYYDKYVEKNPYTKTEKTYTVPLYSKIKLNITYKNNLGVLKLEPTQNSTFNKTYINTFTIFFGISQVNITQYARMVTEGNSQTAASTLDIRIYGVGKINVTVIFNGQKTYYEFQEYEDKVLSFSEYGTYQVNVVDEMGTTAAKSFSYQKSLNTSAFLLIGLSAILVLGIVIFIIRARTKVSTR